MAKRLDQDRQQKVEPERMQYAKEQLAAYGYEILDETQNQITFRFKGSLVRLFPYSGWHTGSTIQDGRGIHNLLKQIKV